MKRLPIRLRLTLGFALAMAVLLTLAGAFVFWRVRISLDSRLNQDLRVQSADLVQAVRRLPPGAALRSLRDEAREAQLYAADGTVIVSGPGIAVGERLLTREQARAATRSPLRTHSGNLLTHHGALRVLAVPVSARGDVTVAAMAVRLDQREEALRELLAQLAIGNALALLIASALGYRFARAALDPVERYRRRADEITHGAAGMRLDVPPEPRDELTRLGDTLNEMIDALERAAERERHFIDDASHELRTPLTTLAAEIDVALRKPRTPEAYEATLRRLDQTTRELLDLAETLLSIGALGGSVAALHDLPAAQLLESAARRAGGQVDPSQREIRIEADEPIVVTGDRALLERALGNLADNAVRHGAGAIDFSARTRADGRFVELAVHDEGAIDPDFLEHAAERFRRHEDARAGTGTGLGLSLVDAIVLAHGGQLRVCSGGTHHARPASRPELDQLPCSHEPSGTTITLLVPSSRDACDAARESSP